MSLRTLRVLSCAEGVSLLTLLLVAMPLKYAFQLPIAVRIVGSVHGGLFLVLLFVCVRAALERLVSKQLAAALVGWSVLPFGFVFADRALRSVGAGCVSSDLAERDFRALSDRFLVELDALRQETGGADFTRPPGRATSRRVP